MKKFLKTAICIVVVLIMCLGVLCACDNNENDLTKRGEFYSLEEVYEQGLISKTDLQNIAYWLNVARYDFDETEFEGFIPSPKNPDTLSKETSDAIKETCAYDLRHDAKSPYKEAMPANVEIINYYGTYNGYVAVLIIDDYHGFFNVVTDIVIDGIKFHYNNYLIMQLWKAI